MHPSEALSPRDALGARLAAFVVDLVVILLAAGPLAGAAGWAMAAVFAVLYGTFAGVTGYSCGKAILGAKVVKAGTTDAPGPVAGFLRALIGLVELTIFPIAAIVSGTNDRRRRVGDLVAGTEVVGVSPPGPVVARYALGYVALLSLFLGLSTVNTLLILWALLIPLAVFFAGVVFGSRREAAAIPWLVLAGFTIVPASYLTFSGLCAKGQGTCVDVASERSAGIPPLIIAVAALAAFFLLAAGIRRAVLAVGATVAAVLLALHLFDTTSMKIGAWLLLILIAVGVVSEVLGRLAAQREARAEATAAAAA
jgi:uncharacterized RDD family membrane protein YckC